MFQSWIGIFATYSYMDDQSFIVIELFLVRNGEERRDKERGREHCVLHSPNNASSFSSDRNRLQRNFCKPSTIFQTQPGDGILWNQFYTCNMMWTSSNCKISVAIVPFNNLLQSQEYQYLVASYFLDYGKPSLMLFCYWFKFLQLFFIITPFT